MDRAFESFEKITVAMKTHPYWFDPTAEFIDTTVKLYESGYAAMLKNRDEHGRRVFYTRISKFNPKLFTFDDIIRLHALATLFLTYEYETQVCGAVITYDLSGLTMEHMSIFSAQSFIGTTELIGSIPIRIKKINIVGLPPFAVTLFEFVKSFLSKKIRNRIALVPPTAENEYGENDVENIREKIDELLSRTEQFRDIHIVDEYLKKCGEQHEEIGSFRKLEID